MVMVNVEPAAVMVQLLLPALRPLSVTPTLVFMTATAMSCVWLHSGAASHSLTSREYATWPVATSWQVAVSCVWNSQDTARKP